MQSKNETIVLGGGCFWCTEAVFSRLKGIVKTNPGYAGGTTKNPTYEEVCSNKTGHAEVLQVEYDPKAIPLGKILEIFFSMHDPTSINRQGEDVGSQYRSIILYTSEEQRKTIEESIAEAQTGFEKPIATEVKKLDVFYPSEDYHKDYYKVNPFQPYCMLVIRPKVKKLEKEFKSDLK